MRVLTILLATAALCLSAFIFVPTPVLAALPLVIAVREYSPWLFLFCFLSLALAFRFCRRVIPLAALSACLACWPLYQIHAIRLLTTPSSRFAASVSPSLSSVLSHCLESIFAKPVQPQKLPLNILFYRPEQTGLRPALIDIYGGGWQNGAPNQTHQFDSYMARHGYAVFAIDYRHAPAFRFPDQLDDVEAALQFLYRNASRYHVDPNRLVLCGRSSGAELALLAAYRKQGVPIRGVISFYGPTDLKSGYFDLPSPDPINVQAVLKTYLGGSPEERPDAYQNASPVHYVAAALPATLLIQGASDHIVKPVFAQELFSKLNASGDRAALLMLPWSTHGFDLAFAGLGNQICLPYIEAFLQSITNS